MTDHRLRVVTLFVLVVLVWFYGVQTLYMSYSAAGAIESVIETEGRIRMNYILL